MTVVVSRANKALVVPWTATTANMFPAAPRLPDGRCVVSHGLGEYVLLRRLGYPVLHPMLAYYDWGGVVPFKVQQSTCCMLTTERHAYVLNDLGTGKTKSVLWGWDYNNKEGYAKKLLVVAPLSTLSFVWAREVTATLPHRKAVVLHGTKEKRLAKLADPEADIFIINHDGMKVMGKELAARTDIDTLVLDELAAYRNRSARTKQMIKFAEHMEWVWGLTGRPMPNEPTDVYWQCRVITPNTVPKYETHARDMLMTRINQWVWKPKPDAVEVAYRMMQPSVRFKLEDVTELPPVIERTIDVQMSPKQDRIYKEIVKVCVAMAGDKTITAVNAAAAMTKLLQTASGWVYAFKDGKRTEVCLDPQPRLDALIDLIEAAPSKVIVFIPFRHALAGVSAALTAAKIKHAQVHGDTAGRDFIFNEFQNGNDYDVLAAHPQCMAHGLTLTSASTIIWYCPTPDLEIYEQANARIRRIGQKLKQQVLHLQSTPIERRIYSLLRSKQRVQDQLLEMFEDATTAAL